MARGRVEVITKGLRSRLNSFYEGETRKAPLQVREAVMKESREYKSRDRCSVCGDPQEWFRLEPGSGRCVRCQT